MNCCQPNHYDDLFDADLAAKEMKRFLKKGPRPSTSKLISGILDAYSSPDFSLIDIGSGVGAIPFSLAEKGASRIVDIDASSAYQKAVSIEAVGREIDDRFEFITGDFVALEKSIDSADIVSLDRVICCYENMQMLVGRSVEKANRVYALVYPRSEWWTKFFFSLANIALRVSGKVFRTFVHDSEEVEDIVTRAGFSKSFHHNGLIWQVAVFVKD